MTTRNRFASVSLVVKTTSLKDGHCRMELRFKGETEFLSEKREDGK